MGLGGGDYRGTDRERDERDSKRRRGCSHYLQASSGINLSGKLRFLTEDLITETFSKPNASHCITTTAKSIAIRISSH